MQLEEHLVDSTSGEYSRKVWLLRSVSEKPQNVCVFLDAEYYLNRMNASGLLRDLQTSEMIPPITSLFVSHVESASRHSDFTCNPRYSEFIAQDLLSWASRQIAPISEGGNSICGLSLSGLASAYLAISYPQVFSGSLCQSGAFWWNQEWLTRNISASPLTGQKFWISAGNKENTAGISHPPTGIRQEVSQITAAETIAEKLSTLGAEIHYHLFSGGHEIAPWQKELPGALRWLIGSPR